MNTILKRYVPLILTIGLAVSSTNTCLTTTPLIRDKKEISNDVDLKTISQISNESLDQLFQTLEADTSLKPEKKQKIARNLSILRSTIKKLIAIPGTTLSFANKNLSAIIKYAVISTISIAMLATASEWSLGKDYVIEGTLFPLLELFGMKYCQMTIGSIMIMIKGFFTALSQLETQELGKLIGNTVT
ncbi:MAG: hypothetical protein V1855_03255, partial [bacterium]